MIRKEWIPLSENHYIYAFLQEIVLKMLCDAYHCNFIIEFTPKIKNTSYVFFKPKKAKQSSRMTTIGGVPG